jgi:hypothetical protein
MYVGSYVQYSTKFLERCFYGGAVLIVTHSLNELKVQILFHSPTFPKIGNNEMDSPKYKTAHFHLMFYLNERQYITAIQLIYKTGNDAKEPS